MESWDIVTNLITPHNLYEYGNPRYETLASCLGLLVEYNAGPAKNDNDETKVSISNENQFDIALIKRNMQLNIIIP